MIRTRETGENSRLRAKGSLDLYTSGCGQCVFETQLICLSVAELSIRFHRVFLHQYMVFENRVYSTYVLVYVYGEKKAHFADDNY